MNKIFLFLEIKEFSSPLFYQKRHISEKKRKKNNAGKWIEKKLGNFVKKLPYTCETLLYYPFSSAVKKPNLEKDIQLFLSQELKEDCDLFRKITGDNFAYWSL